MKCRNDQRSEFLACGERTHQTRDLQENKAISQEEMSAALQKSINDEREHAADHQRYAFRCERHLETPVKSADRKCPKRRDDHHRGIAFPSERLCEYPEQDKKMTGIAH